MYFSNSLVLVTKHKHYFLQEWERDWEPIGDFPKQRPNQWARWGHLVISDDQLWEAFWQSLSWNRGILSPWTSGDQRWFTLRSPFCLDRKATHTLYNHTVICDLRKGRFLGHFVHETFLINTRILSKLLDVIYSALERELDFGCFSQYSCSQTISAVTINSELNVSPSYQYLHLMSIIHLPSPTCFPCWYLFNTAFNNLHNWHNWIIWLHWNQSFS